MQKKKQYLKKYLIVQKRIARLSEMALQNPKNKFASEIISSDGERIGTFFTAKDNRIFTTYNEISPNVINALIATEDARFYSHSGIDGQALLRVLIKRGILQQSGAGGGSTITQQLAKQLYSPTASNIFELRRLIVPLLSKRRKDL